MKRRLVWLLGVAALAAVVGGGLASCARKAQEAAPTETTADAPAEDQWAVCAYDGMVMKRRAMGASAEYEGRTLYFCNADHKARFLAAPEKYQRTWQAFGHEVAFNMLSIYEHMAAMRDMRLNMEQPSDTTHHVTLCAMAGPESLPVTDLTVSARLTSPDGKAVELDLPLASDGKHYAANVKLPGSGEYQVEVTLRRDDKEAVHSFRHVVQ